MKYASDMTQTTTTTTTKKAYVIRTQSEGFYLVASECDYTLTTEYAEATGFSTYQAARRLFWALGITLNDFRIDGDL